MRGDPEEINRTCREQLAQMVDKFREERESGRGEEEAMVVITKKLTFESAWLSNDGYSIYLMEDRGSHGYSKMDLTNILPKEMIPVGNETQGPTDGPKGKLTITLEFIPE